MNGTGESTFGPALTVTRGIMHQTLYNMAGCPAVAEAASFSDVSGQWYAAAVADWAKDGMERAVALGILSDARTSSTPLVPPSVLRWLRS